MNVTRLNCFTPFLKLVRFCHVGRNPGRISAHSNERKPQLGNVGIFWDLNHKFPKGTKPYEAAMRLRKSVYTFGITKYMVAFADRHLFSYVLPPVKNYKEKKITTDIGIVRLLEKHTCKLCGRKFNAAAKLLKHFPLHVEEYRKRVSAIEAAKGKRRVVLMGMYALKLERFRKASMDLNPIVEYNLVDELKQAGYCVEDVCDWEGGADVALKNCMMDLMKRKKVQYLVLVSNNPEFLDVLAEAKKRRVKTLIVGDQPEGTLKKGGDGAFSWKDIFSGKLRNRAVTIAGRWRDHDILERLEWTYVPKVEKDVDERSDTPWFKYSDDHGRRNRKDANKRQSGSRDLANGDDEEYEDATEENDRSLLGKVDKPWWAVE